MQNEQWKFNIVGDILVFDSSKYVWLGMLLDEYTSISVLVEVINKKAI